ncbi:MAG: hypothetical protein IPP44_19935 [Ideonella sp.]|nr:hypothetical protein [Ideonella sp.]
MAGYLGVRTTARTAGGLLALLLCLGEVWAQPTVPNDLRARYDAARTQSVRNTFDRPVYLQSTEASDKLQGDVYALIGQPYDTVRQALARPGPWCSILILHLNVKYCRASNQGGRDLLDAGVGRKFDQPLSDVHWVRFDHRVISVGDDYLQVELQAPTGPLGTKDYRIMVEAMPFAERQSLLHMTYAYGFGLTARLAMQAYLATVGSDKVGFSIVGQRADGQPIRVGGLRGVLERNTMRYYLAVESHLGAAALPVAQQLPKSLQDWFAATERYPQQLHEIERDDYLQMKQAEVRRQETGPAPPINR